MVESLWSEKEAAEFVDAFAAAGTDIALRVYTSRLIGRDTSLVLHGGGNTSVKTMVRDILGEQLPVLAVKGSGWDLVDLEPPGLPLVELEPLRRLLELPVLGDGEMVNEVRRRLLDSSAPNPSVEALLHAALPHKFVDHTHADAIVALTNQPDGADMVRQALGDRVVVLPWIMPGLPLAKAVAAAWAAAPEVEGIVLVQHGIFTFADDARQSYERMIDLVGRAERYLHARCPRPPMLMTPPDAQPPDEAVGASILPVVRGALALPEAGEGRRPMVASWRRKPDLIAFSRHPECRFLIERGPITPDHVIRTKGRYLYLGAAAAADPLRTRAAVADYVEKYTAYFHAGAGRSGQPLRMLDPHPRVVVVEGLGLIGFGPDKTAADIAADIAEHTLRTKALGAGVGTYTELPPEALFEMEYWSLEQSKLGKQTAPLLGGRVALITGAGGAIGDGIAAALAGAGAAVVVTDVDASRRSAVVDRVRAQSRRAAVLGIEMDVTDDASVDRAFAASIAAFGGVDIVVANAGIAHVGELQQMDSAAFRRVLDVNFYGTMTVLRAAARVFRLQGTGGSVIVQASKNVFAPGAAFGAYSSSKAGAHQLGKIAAMELAPLGVRVNMINADAVFGDDVPSRLWQEIGPERMQARGLDAEGLRDYYRQRSLLGCEVTPRHVGEAVVFLASERSAATTGVTLTVDGGLPGAFPR